MKKNLLFTVLLSVVIIFLTACGGGSGGGSTTPSTPDENTTALHFTSDSIIYVPENEINAFVLKAVSDNNITYAISGGDSAAFSVDAVTGEVIFKTAPDFETRQSYSFTASANDGVDTVTQNILIFIEDIDESIPKFISASEINVVENQLKAVNLRATDDQPITYSLSGTDSNAFEVNATTGKVTFKTAPDYESKNLYTFTAEASDGTNVGKQNVIIHIIDIDETLPLFTSSATVSVVEKQLTAITLQATDEHPLLYGIYGGDSLKFTVNQSTGVVSFKIAPDYENQNVYTFTATANDGTNISKQNVTIQILNLDESAPIFVSADTVTVKENQLNAITLSATDNSTLTYSISGGDSASFNINSTNGVVTFKTPADYETKNSYTFTATVSDGTYQVTQNVTIKIEDVDENIPVFSSATSVSVEENQLSAITLSATDDNNITYSISGTDSSEFNLNATSGEVTFKSAPDYETKNSYTFTAVASDGTNETTQDVTITIINIDETTPSFTSASSASVEENQLSAITLSATDTSNTSDENNISYSISGTDSSAFNVNATSGEVTFKSAPDYETKNSYTFTAVASDGTNTITQDVTITIIDIDESAPIFVSATSVSVEENQLNAITLSATDDNNITYSISGTDSAEFNLNATSGEVTFKSAPDYETKNSYTFRATASDGTNETTQDVTITIIDIDEKVPVFSSDATVSVEENQLNAVTLHANDNNTLTYSISGGDSAAFNVDSASGEVTFKIAPDYETKNLYTFTAAVNDGTHSVTQEVTINIIDVNEVPVFISSSTASVKENQRSAITLNAEDDGNLSYSINGGDSESFIIDSLSGVVTFKTDPDYETKNFYTFTGVANDGTNVVNQSITIDILDVEERDKKTGQLKSYDENGIEVTDGTLSDDGYYQNGVSASYSNASDIVRDEITGLMWQDNEEAKTVTKPWLTAANYDECDNNNSSPVCYDTSGDTAVSYCEALDLGGYTDWRLPTQEELETIVDYSRSAPAIDISSFNNTNANVYWSATTRKDNPIHTWIVYFEYGSVYDVAKNVSYNVRCTRNIEEE